MGKTGAKAELGPQLRVVKSSPVNLLVTEDNIGYKLMKAYMYILYIIQDNRLRCIEVVMERCVR